jgi:hypothetical protein
METEMAEQLMGSEVKDVYQVYYGSLATFQQGGQVWKVWNTNMKKCLLGSQRKGSTKELGGSWNPSADHTAKDGGRVMMTALCALCLEVYYRYDSLM